jgi:SAM-dependent methyltransferase
MPDAAYTRKPYKTYARKECDPSRLGAIARLYGLETALPSACRMAELGCGSGGNLIPLAERYPGSSFLGIDAAQGHIDEARAMSESLGLGNIEWVCADLVHYALDRAGFDYIVAHGLFSWVPQDVQRRLLQLCKRGLAPHGVALISYNTLPGWRQRGAARDIMQVGAALVGGLDPDEQLNAGLAMLRVVASERAGTSDLYGSYLREMLARFEGSESSYLFHEFLEEHNNPCLFSAFMERAQQEGLQFLSEAKVSLMSSEGLGSDAQKALAQLGEDIVAREQVLDLFRNRMFRETMLCDERHAVRRDLKASVFKELFFRTTFRRARGDDESSACFRELVSGRELPAPTGMVSDILAAAGSFGAPGARPADIQAHASAATGQVSHADLVAALITLWRAGFVEISCDNQMAAPDAQVLRPLQFSVRQAEQGGLVTSLRHEALELSHEEREIVAACSTGDERAVVASVAQKRGVSEERVLDGISRLCELGFFWA